LLSLPRGEAGNFQEADPIPSPAAAPRKPPAADVTGLVPGEPPPDELLPPDRPRSSLIPPAGLFGELDRPMLTARLPLPRSGQLVSHLLGLATAARPIDDSGSNGGDMLAPREIVEPLPLRAGLGVRLREGPASGWLTRREGERDRAKRALGLDENVYDDGEGLVPGLMSEVFPAQAFNRGDIGRE